MKLLTVFVILFSFMLCIPTYAQKIKKGDKITALKLKKKSALKFHNGLSIQGFTVDKVGILRPDKDFEIVILYKTKQVLVKPKGREYVMIDNVEVRELPDGSIQVCHCGFGAGDNCRIRDWTSGSDTQSRCEGSCDCGSFYIEIVLNIAEYETSDGNWRPPDWGI